MMMKKITLFFCALFLIPALTFGQQTMSNRFEGIEKIELNIHVGDLVVERSTGNAVEVKVTYNEEDVSPKMEVRGDRLILDEKILVKNNADETDWVLKIPDNLSMESNIGVGSADFSGLTLDLDHNSGVGRTMVDGLSGKMKINSGTGKIDVRNSEGDLDLNSGTGAVGLEQVSGRIKANSGTGNVNADGIRLTEKSSFNSGTGSVNAAGVAVNAETSFNSGTGSVGVALAQPLTADITVNSGTSNATLDFAGQPLSGFFEMECEERRGKIVAPFEFDTEETRKQNKDTIVRKTARIGQSDVNVKVSSYSGRATVKK